jgi:uncharacterized OsmC-like protein
METRTNQVWLAPGDVLSLSGGAPTHVVDFVNDSRARCVPVRAKVKVIHALEGDVTVVAQGDAVNIATNVSSEFVVERFGSLAKAKDFLLREKARQEAELKQQNQEKEKVMARKKSAESTETKTRTRKPRGGLAAQLAESKESKDREVKDSPEPNGHRVGSLGGVFGHSATSVMRALGAAGCSNARIGAILEAKGVAAKKSTVTIQGGRGRSGRGGAPAELSKAELKELMDLAAEPVKETAAA